jgi:4-hydroxybenzoyl-CoA thioesterase
VCDFVKYGCDLVYRLSEKASGRVVAIAKTGIVFMNYAERKVVQVPGKFKKLFRPRKYSLTVQG